MGLGLGALGLGLGVLGLWCSVLPVPRTYEHRAGFRGTFFTFWARTRYREGPSDYKFGEKWVIVGIGMVCVPKLVAMPHPLYGCSGPA